MAKGHTHPNHRICFQGDLGRNHSSGNLPDEKDRSGLAFLVFDHDGNVINAQGRRSHAARVGHLRGMKAVIGEESSPIHRYPRPECNMPAPYKSLLTTFRAMNNSKKHKSKSMVPMAVPLLVEDDHKRIEADRERLVSAALKHQHSMRHLQLDVFPLKIKGRAKAAYTYYTEIYIPTAFRRSQFQGITQDLSLLRDQLPFFLSDKVIFAAVLARAILQKDLLSGKSGKASVDAAHAYGVALGYLHRHLVYAMDKVSDMFISALVFLIAFDNMLNNSGRVCIHAAALEKAIACRGGLEKLGLKGQLATATASLILHNQSQQGPIMRNGKSVQRFHNLKPPDHPFSPKIRTQIAMLTPAFEELCLREQLVEPVIDLLARISGWRDTLHPSNDIQNWISHPLSLSALDADHENATTCIMLLQNPNLPLKDQLAVMALCALVDYIGRHSFPHQAFLQSHAGLIPSDLLNTIVRETRNDEWLTWVALILLASSPVNTVKWSTGMLILDQQESQQSWEHRLVICEKYFWNTDFSLMLLQKVQQCGSSLSPGAILDGIAT